MGRCDIKFCRENATWVMFDDKKAILYLCFEHAKMIALSYSCIAKISTFRLANGQKSLLAKDLQELITDKKLDDGKNKKLCML